MITARLRIQPVAHGGLSPPWKIAEDTQRTAKHRTKMITVTTIKKVTVALTVAGTARGGGQWGQLPRAPRLKL
jgi:hypothetical protein